MQTIQLHDKHFEAYISSEKIQEAIKNLAKQIALNHQTETPIFIGVLNGAFMFCADLLKAYTQPCEISFIKLSSYEQTNSTGVVNEVIGLNKSIKNRAVVVLEDIIDTGNTIEKIIPLLKKNQPKSIEIATLFLKPDVYKKEKSIDYVGLEIPNDFIVGYGLDYDELGRNLPEIYKLA